MTRFTQKEIQRSACPAQRCAMHSYLRKSYMNRALPVGVFAALWALSQTGVVAADDGPDSHLSAAPHAPQSHLQSHATDGGSLSSTTPQGQLQSQPPAGELTSSTPQSTLRSTQAPQSVLREAEVPAHLLERTRVLMQELQAKPTPQQDISIDLPADVLFDFDKAHLRADAQPAIAKAAQLLQSYPQAPVLVRGHTDGKGSDAYNDDLSLRRAQTVAAALEQRSGRTHIMTEGMGKRQPIAPNAHPDGRDNPEGRQKNRRVQILIRPATT